MSTLDQIVAYKKEELYVRKLMVGVNELIESKYFEKKCLSLKESLLKENGPAIIAEFKRKSPAKGFINQHADVSAVTTAYTQFGASALSIFTDHHFFGGSTADLVKARVNKIPILRKDLILESYQVIASKAMGADAILLIAACLSKEEVKNLSSAAKQLGMEVVLEIHSENELDHICDEVDMITINNRDLRSFKVDIDHATALSKKIPADKIKIAESSISKVETIKNLKDAGYTGFLMGDVFMKENDPGMAFENFVNKLK